MNEQALSHIPFQLKDELMTPSTGDHRRQIVGSRWRCRRRGDYAELSTSLPFPPPAS